MLLQKPPLVLHDRLRQSCHLKRFFECWMADPDFRQQLRSDPEAATAARGLTVSPDTFRLIWDWFTTSPGDAGQHQLRPEADIPPALIEFHALKQAERDYQDRLRARAAPVNINWQRWRARQMARMSSQFGAGLLQVLLHPPFACELTRGCSVGCWFCGVGALRLDDHFAHSPANAELWRGVLGALGEFTGRASGGHGFLYWATDPLDNPDYEEFASDFHRIFARYPDVTTSQPVKHMDRLRRLIALSANSDDFYVRISVLTLRQLYALHGAFTAEELATVSLIPRNRGSLAPIAPVGNARHPTSSQSSTTTPSQDTTIACVSGFLLNMVERSIKLVTPCPVSDRWPLGYIIYAHATFDNAADLSQVIARMIAAHMPAEAPPDRPLRFRTDLAYASGADGFTLTSPHASLAFRGNPLMDVFGDLIHQGTYRPDDVADILQREFAVGSDVTQEWVQLLFDSGVLDESPQPVAPPS